MQALCCSVIELRRYTTHPGQRDVLIDLFEREFVETQEVHGTHVVGQFRDLDRPDMFVWLRGFTDMATRADALHAFYGGPVWKEHREGANATMVDSDNVLLLRPAFPDTGLAHPGGPRPSTGASHASESLVEVIIYPLAAPANTGLLHQLASVVLPELREASSAPHCYVTETAENTFPALPVRVGDNVLVWLRRYNGSMHRVSGTQATDTHRTSDALASLEPYFSGPPETLRLHATARSQLR
jgi:hypothetical protein